MSDHHASAKKNSVIVLLSGGLDSTVALAACMQEHAVDYVLTFDYGQRAVEPEFKAAQSIAKHYGLKHQFIVLPWLKELLPNAMSAQSEAPETWQGLDDDELFDVERVWVPNRNGVFLNIAASFAEAKRASFILFGANAEEGASFPDNTPEFQDAINHSLSYSTLKGVKVISPVGHLHKNEIVALGRRLKVPFELIWSCYGAGPEPCKACPSCLRLIAAQAVA